MSFYTGYQKGLFQDQQNPEEETSGTHQDLCPAGCGEVESHLHYITCPCHQFHHCRSTCLHALKKKLVHLATAPPLIAVLIHAIMLLCANRPVQFDLLPASSIMETQLPSLIAAQNKIGWLNLFKGTMSSQWRDIQQSYYKTSALKEKHHTGSYWLTCIIKQLNDFTHTMWTCRNKILHGESILQQNIITKEKLSLQVTELYATQEQFPRDKHWLFDQTIETLLKQPILHIENWINLAATILDFYDKKPVRTLPSMWKVTN
jgi:hypothetical protein